VRENTEGECSEIGGRLFAGTDLEYVVQESVFPKRGVDRIVDFAFQLAQSRRDKHLTSAIKSNGIMHSMPFWDERFDTIGREYPCLPYRLLTADPFIDHYGWPWIQGIRAPSDHRKRIRICQHKE
jgi:isocitrate/isopropylmalate dehydrogenase